MQVNTLWLGDEVDRCGTGTDVLRVGDCERHCEGRLSEVQECYRLAVKHLKQ